MRFSLLSCVVSLACVGAVCAQELSPRDLSAYADNRSSRIGDILTLSGERSGGLSPAVAQWLDASGAGNSSTRAAVMVVDVLPNGNLIIEGARPNASACEVLRGVVRAGDVSSSATIAPSQIARASIESVSEVAQSSSRESLVRLDSLTHLF